VDITDIIIEKYLLITYERALSAQAKVRKFLILTNERKKMSTKTTFKRVALVAVVALGLGGLSTVPASAGVANITATVAVASATASTAVGTAATTNFNTVTTLAATAADTVTYSVAVTSKPADSSLAVAAPAATATAAKVQFITGNETAATGWALTTATNTRVDTADTSTTQLAATSVRGTVSVSPDKAGIYVITLTATPSGSGSATTATFTVYAGKSLDSLHANTAFPTQGTNITSGWSAAAGGVATVRFTNFAASKVYYVTSTANINGTVDQTASTHVVASNTNGTNLSGGVTLTSGASTTKSDAFDIQLNSLVTGTQTVTVVSYDATTGVSSTFSTVSLTVGEKPGPSAQYSLLTLNAAGGTTATGAADDITATTVAKTAGTKRFTIQVVVKDQNNNTFNAPTLAASISGPGQLGIADGTGGAAISGRSISVALTAGTGSVDVYGDGSAGAATITITATSGTTTTTLGTKKVTFVGSASKVVATQNLYVAKAGTTLGATPSTNYLTNDGTTMALTPAFTVEVTDSNGNDIAAGATVKMTSSDSTKIVVGTCAEYIAYPGNFECSVSGATGAASGASATVTFSVYNSTTQAYDIVGNALTFSVGEAIAKVTPTLDAVSYSAGQKMVLKYTAVDSSGNAAYDGQAPVSAVASNKSVGGALPAVTKFIKNGYYATSATAPTLFAPSVGGDFTISGTTIATVAAPLGTAWSLTATVNTVGDAAANAATDAANEATDAANAATDAALAAADAADAATAAAQDASDAVAALSATVATLVAGLKAQITSLTNLVIKIQKKVKA